MISTAISAIFLGVAPMAGEPSSSEVQLRACLASGDAARGVTSAMKACSMAEYRRRDAILNAAYVRRMRSLPIAARERLRIEERSWIRSRDSTCSVRMGNDSGSLDSLDYLDCVIDQTIARTKCLTNG